VEEGLGTTQMKNADDEMVALIAASARCAQYMMHTDARMKRQRLCPVVLTFQAMARRLNVRAYG
jgi:hypothetical protein